MLQIPHWLLATLLLAGLLGVLTLIPCLLAYYLGEQAGYKRGKSGNESNAKA